MQIRDRITDFRRVPASELIPNALNWRRHPQSQSDALKGVLDEIGFADAVIARQTPDGLELIDGHLRADVMGDDPVPVLIVDLTDEESLQLLLTLDPLAMMAEKDDDTVALLLEKVSFDDDAVMRMLDELEMTSPPPLPDVVDVPEVDPDLTDELQAKWQTSDGQIWQVGNHRIMCGNNATDLPTLMDGALGHMVVTSPPYNQDIQSFKPSGMQKESPNFVNRMASAYMDTKDEDEYRQEQLALLLELAHHMESNASIFYNHKIRYRDKHIISPLEWLLELPFPIRQEIIWNRGSSITMNARMLIPADERIYWIRTGEDFTFHDDTEIKSWSTVWDISARNEYQVSAPFPNELPNRCIRMASNPGELVIDPYLGSGTTMAVAEQLGRRCYGMEINPSYVAVTLERMSLIGYTPKLVNDGKTQD